MNLQMFSAVPAWASTLALVFSIAVPTTMWHAFQRAGTDAKIAGARRTSIWIAIILFFWMALAVFLSLRGFFEADPSARIPNLAYLLLPLLAGVILWPASRSFRETVCAIRKDWMIRIQLYRTIGFLYLVGWHYGLMPAAFALPAGVGDSLVGLSAPFVAWMVRHRRIGAASAATLWNTFGLVDIVSGVTLGVLTSPGPLQRLAKDAPGIAITTFPLVLLPAILVPLSVLCHLYSLRVGPRVDI